MHLVSYMYYSRKMKMETKTSPEELKNFLVLSRKRTSWGSRLKEFTCNLCFLAFINTFILIGVLLCCLFRAPPWPEPGVALTENKVSARKVSSLAWDHLLWKFEQKAIQNQLLARSKWNDSWREMVTWAMRQLCGFFPLHFAPWKISVPIFFWQTTCKNLWAIPKRTVNFWPRFQKGIWCQMQFLLITIYITTYITIYN